MENTRPSGTFTERKAGTDFMRVLRQVAGGVRQHWICLAGLWQNPHRSLVKGCQMIKEQTERLANCLNDVNALMAFLKELAERFNYSCSLNARKKKPNTSQRIDSKYAFS
jgi:hypothetical protein